MNAEDEKCCRLCAKSEKNENLESLFEPRSIKLKQIRDITGLKLRHGKNLPETICAVCCIGLEQAHQFRELCLQTHKYFASAKYKQHLKDKDKTKQTEDKEELNKIMDEPQLSMIKRSDSSSHESVEKLWLTVEETKSQLLEDAVDIKEENSRESQVTASSDTPYSIEDDSDNEGEKLGKRKGKSKQKAKSFVCDQCGSHLPCQSVFETHLRRHAGDKPFQCEQCTEKFYTKLDRQRHMWKHTGVKPFPCRQCERRFTDYSARLRHERRHNNDRPFSCKQCDKAFTTSWVLKNHMLTHTGERSFYCRLCDRSFSRATHLQTHYRSMMHIHKEAKQVSATTTQGTSVLEPTLI